MYDALPLLKQSELKFGVFGQQIKIYTGKSFSEALILESVNAQYDKIFFIEFPEKYKFATCCVQILFWMSKQNKLEKDLDL